MKCQEDKKNISKYCLLIFFFFFFPTSLLKSILTVLIYAKLKIFFHFYLFFIFISFTKLSLIKELCN